MVAEPGPGWQNAGAGSRREGAASSYPWFDGTWRDQAETPDPFMADRLTLEPRPVGLRDEPPASRPQRPATMVAGAALARRPTQAPLPVEPRGPAPRLPAQPGGRRDGTLQRARLVVAGLPLARRMRLRGGRLDRPLGGSTALHVLLLVLLALLYGSERGPKQPTDQPPIEVVFGKSGMVGAPVSTDNGGGHPPASVAPTPPTPTPPAPQPEVSPEPPSEVPPEQPLIPPVPAPELEPLPVPEVPPQARPAQTPHPPTRIPLRTARPTARSSPFSHPQDFSFEQGEPGPPRYRSGRPSGSRAPVDLSLGPLVKNGRLNTPFATVGIKGVSDDYEAEIDAWIRRHLYYPPDAAQRGEDGPSHVHVVLDRSGRVKGVSLVTSSGSYALDDATMGMFRNAHLPQVPPDMVGDHFDIDLTVNYILIR